MDLLSGCLHPLVLIDWNQPVQDAVEDRSRDWACPMDVVVVESTCHISANSLLCNAVDVPVAFRSPKQRAGLLPDVISNCKTGRLCGIT